MRPSTALVVLAIAAAPDLATAEVAVRVSGGQVDLTATAAPLAEVLDRLARQTGMKVVYEGPAPRQIVTLSLHGRTLTETILSVFEGLGVNFALVADPAGSRVQTLVVAGTATASSSPSSGNVSRLPAPAPQRRPPGASPETVDPAFEETDEEPLGDENPGVPPGAEVAEPVGALTPPADPALANPAAQVPGAPPGQGLPTLPAPRFSPSPFMPQPQPFTSPAAAPVVPQAPAGSPPPDEGAPPANPPTP